MRKFTLFIVTMLCSSLIVMAQLKLFVYQKDGTRSEFIASNVDSIAFSQENDFSGPNANGHEYVNLGLPSGTLWATMNVGANSPEEFGEYFSWGEIRPKAKYNENTYSYNGEIELALPRDAANANWGGMWRTPTQQEQQELVDNCKWTWSSKNGVNGYIIEGPNSNSIFLPAAGYMTEAGLVRANEVGNYWSRSREGISNVDQACGMAFYINYISAKGQGRSYKGNSIRPVLK